MTRNVTREPELIYHDFEYRDDGRELVLGCFLNAATGERVAIDFRDPVAGSAQLASLQARWIDAIWVSYAAHAEMSAFLTAGLDIRDMLYIDLFAEARQITGSHSSFFSRKAGLIDTLTALGIPVDDRAAAVKEAMRLLILHERNYTSEQWDQIVAYCWSDLEPLREMWRSIQAIHRDRGHRYSTRAAVFRAEYLKATAILEHNSRGFPIDMPFARRVFSNQKLLRCRLAEWCNEQFKGEVFRHNPQRDEYSFSFCGLYECIATLPYDVDWAKTPSGKYRLDEDYLSEFAARNPYFSPLAKTRTMLNGLKSGNMIQQIRDGFLPGASIAYYTVTGRNQPLPGRGFILGLPPWIRHLVRPEPHHVLISADFSQQEVVLAAALSGDRALASALATGDVYMAAARMAGAVPPDATKATHGAQRATYKAVILGTGYGMGARTLGQRIYFDLRAGNMLGDLTMEDCNDKAVEILQWHRSTFTTFWRWANTQIACAKERGYIEALDGWTLFADQNSRPTQLQNFPVQANAAVILREAVKLLAAALYDNRGIEFVCSLHDAIYLYCHEDDAIHAENVLTRCMGHAVRSVMQHTSNPLTIKIDRKIYTHESGYTDERGTEMLARVRALLDEAGV